MYSSFSASHKWRYMFASTDVSQYLMVIQIRCPDNNCLSDKHTWKSNKHVWYSHTQRKQTSSLQGSLIWIYAWSFGSGENLKNSFFPFLWLYSRLDLVGLSEEPISDAHYKRERSAVISLGTSTSNPCFSKQSIAKFKREPSCKNVARNYIRDNTRNKMSSCAQFT